MSEEKRAIKIFPLPSPCHFQWPVFQDWWHHTPGRHHIQPSDLSLNQTQAEGTDLHRQRHTWKEAQRLWAFRGALVSSQWLTFQKEIMGTVPRAPCIFDPVRKLWEKDWGGTKNGQNHSQAFLCRAWFDLCGAKSQWFSRREAFLGGKLWILITAEDPWDQFLQKEMTIIKERADGIEFCSRKIAGKRGVIYLFILTSFIPLLSETV